MAIFKKREMPLPLPDSGFPMWNSFSNDVKAVKQEMAVRNSARMEDLPDIPESGMPELPELPSPKSRKSFEIPEAPSRIRKAARADVEEEEREERTPRPLFIKVEKFKEIMDSAETIDKKLREIKGAMQNLREIQEKEVEVMDQWEADIQELKEKLSVIEKTLSQVEK
jgi:hypothetical protein